MFSCYLSRSFLSCRVEIDTFTSTMSSTLRFVRRIRGKICLSRTICSLKWCKNGSPHRINGPACLLYHNGDIEKEEWYIDGLLHRINGPAVVCRQQYNNCDTWYFKGKKHRKNGPAFIYYNGAMKEEAWYKHGSCHKIGKPAYIFYREDGTVRKECWYRNDMRHRLNKPAIIDYDRCIERWFEDGIERNIK